MISAVIQAGMAFNLICSGYMATPIERTSFSETYRVDLQARQFCFDECSVVLPIVRITNDEIVLQDQPLSNVSMAISTRVARKGGKFVQNVEGEIFSARSEGQCEFVAFTGFPPQPR